MRILDNHHRITQIELAARSVGMSYGRYVALTGGKIPPPEELVLAADPKSAHCDFCGKLFLPTMDRNIYCSDACRKAAYDKREAEKERAKLRTCPICGKEFLPMSGKQKYDSAECRRHASYRNYVLRHCSVEV